VSYRRVDVYFSEDVEEWRPPGFGRIFFMCFPFSCKIGIMSS
jgi:hypothetical protein